VTVVNLWAQWCPPCRTEAPVLTSAQRLLRRSGVQFVGVETEDKASLAEKFARAHSWTWPEVDDENGQTLHDAGLASLPDTLVLDRSGRLIGELRGPVTSASGFARAVRRLAG
jgi:thiol-disulfide isomerase/thioredoxin